jgi:hypothetical protein
MLKTVSTQLALASDTLPEVLAKGNTTGGTDLAVSSGDDITFADSSKAIFGAGSDLEIYSDGTAGLIKVNTVYGLGDITITQSADNKGIAILDSTESGAFYLRHNAANTFISNNDTRDMILATNSFDRLTLDGTTGDATFSGNLVIGTSGNGIDFSATAGTGTSELLDDYEEGTFSLASDSAEVVLAANTGYYTKIGRVVTCTGAVTVSSIGTPVGNVGFDGLPFATANVTDIGAAISLYTYGWKTSMTTHVMASLSGNSSSWFVQKSNGAGTVAVLSGDVQATTYIQYTIVYQTA